MKNTLHNLFETAIQTSPLGILVADKTDSIIFTNQQFYKLTGYKDDLLNSKEQLLEKAFPEKSLRAAFRAQWTQCIQEETHATATFPTICADTSVKQIRYHAAFSGEYVVLTLEDTTEQHKGILQIQKSEESYRSVFNAAADGLVVINPENYDVLDANTAFLKLFNLSRLQLRALCLETLLNLDTKEIRPKTQRLQMGQHYTFIQQVHRENEPIVLEITLHRLKISGDERYLLVCRNISKRHAAEKELYNSRVTYQNIFNAISEAIVILDAETHEIRIVNNAAEKLFAEDKESMLGKTPLELSAHYNPEEQATINRRLQTVISNGTQLFEWHTKNKKGNTFWTEVSLQPTVVKGKKHIICTLRNIESRKQAFVQQELAAKVFGQSTDSIIITDAHGHILDANNALCRITGYSKKECLGNKPSLLKSGKHDTRFYKEMWHDVLTKGEWRGEIWNRKKNGQIFPCWLHITRLTDKLGNITNFIGTFTDLTESKRARDSIFHLNNYDLLTDLPNRTLFFDRLQQTMLLQEETRIATLVFGVDGFKTVNESLGLPTGDELLRRVGKRLRNTFHKTLSTGRLAGDEFAIAVTAPSSNQLISYVDKINQTFNQPFVLDNQEIFLTVCTGISLYPDDAKSPEALVTNAESAMHKAKKEGARSYDFFSKEFNDEALERLNIVSALHRSLPRREFELYYQPKVNIAQKKIYGFEALLRWNHAGKIIAPDRFIPILESQELIHQVGEWVIREACRFCKKLHQNGYPEIRMAVNISPKQFQKKDLVDIILKATRDAAISPAYIEIELTEEMLVQDMEKVRATLRSLKNAGFSIALDDFGKGYSSLSYLATFPIDTLKIDKVFMQNVITDQNNKTITSTIISMARNLDMQIVAEGVETQEQVEYLKKKKCPLIQGYYFSPPLPEKKTIHFLQEFRTRIIDLTSKKSYVDY
jgi:diguanylate cyclase (GGDEF)-like protein/PAS domain S-box-containing protein